MITVGSIVKVIAKHPDGVRDINTKGVIGVVKAIEREIHYLVCSQNYINYYYSLDQLTEATSDEIAEAFKKLLKFWEGN